jgi:hypothetical protein
MSALDDLLGGSYSKELVYNSYMKFSFAETSSGEFILNSGLRDNRSIIENLDVG